MTDQNWVDDALDLAPLFNDCEPHDPDLRAEYLDALGLSPSEARPRSTHVRAMKAYLDAPFESDHVSKEELEERWESLLNSHTEEAEDRQDTSQVRSFHAEHLEFRFDMSGVNLFTDLSPSTQGEADHVWFVPYSASGSRLRFTPQHAAKRARKPYAELAVTASQKDRGNAYERLQEALLHLLQDPRCGWEEYPLKLSAEQQQKVTEQALETDQFLLVLVDLHWSVHADRRQRCTDRAAAESLWSDPLAPSRWWDGGSTQWLPANDSTLRAEPAAVLWLCNTSAPPSGTGAAALVPVPKRWQPIREHLDRLDELWASKLVARLHTCGK
ncbi:hypothetical protein AB0L28_29195 [Streptomyces sp. NPDC052503]|uniref:hypothetical protein n=1 Tax=Streptomyces sp. NPDC052503 TaxID=3156683 RepID=UPI00136BD007|nr:hypothetical protein [Streptomyces sp. SID7834]MYT57984.1 hypothetical protein [Streptomyces sp. SID7834]